MASKTIPRTKQKCKKSYLSCQESSIHFLCTEILQINLLHLLTSISRLNSHSFHDICQHCFTLGSWFPWHHWKMNSVLWKVVSLHTLDQQYRKCRRSGSRCSYITRQEVDPHPYYFQKVCYFYKKLPLLAIPHFSKPSPFYFLQLNSTKLPILIKLNSNIQATPQ